MTDTMFLETTEGRRLAYHRTEGKGPGLTFLGGFKSDMTGSKATHLEEWCKAQGRAYLRFDYSGHGQSSGAFTDGCIGDWAIDACEVIGTLTEGPQVLVGSSMGGWISLLIAQRMPDWVAGLVTIAAAPDFTEDGFWTGFSEPERAKLMSEGVVHVPSDYGGPYPITRRLIEDGRQHFVMRSPLALPFPVRMVQGSEDNAVTADTAVRLLDHAVGPDIRLTFVKGKDHSFSDPESLGVIEDAIGEVLSALT